MKTFDRIKTFFQKEIVVFILNILASFFMGSLHLVATIINFSWLTFNYCLFCYVLVAIFAILSRLNQGERGNHLYLIGAICLTVLIVPMTVAMVKTILEREAPAYLFDWLIYGYATYGTIKFICAIRALHKSRKGKKDYEIVTSWISLIDAAFTIQMMEFALIATFEPERSSMLLMQFITHGAVIIFTIFVIVHFIIKFKGSLTDRTAY